jgi:hypothetical protein
MDLKLKPLADRLVVEPTEQDEVTASGIYVPETAKEKPQKGKVVAAGPGSGFPWTWRKATGSCTPSTPAPRSSLRTRSTSSSRKVTS